MSSGQCQLRLLVVGIIMNAVYCVVYKSFGVFPSGGRNVINHRREPVAESARGPSARRAVLICDWWIRVLLSP